MAKHKPNAKARITTRFPFPLDMLRYDSCWPSSGEDTNKIVRSHEGYSRGEYTVVVESAPGRKWTVDRWRSFNCAVDSLES